MKKGSLVHSIEYDRFQRSRIKSFEKSFPDGDGVSGLLLVVGSEMEADDGDVLSTTRDLRVSGEAKKQNEESGYVLTLTRIRLAGIWKETVERGGYQRGSNGASTLFAENANSPSQSLQQRNPRRRVYTSKLRL